MLPPEPFRSALAASRPLSVCDLPASTSGALYGRARARIQVGRDLEARRDLESALALADDDAVRVELAYLDVRARKPLEGIGDRLSEILDREPERSRLRARVQHVFGLVEGKRRNSDVAISALREASAIYRELDLAGDRAQVLDTLGMTFAAMGRLDWALVQYAQSLVEKALSGDQYGMALTLGNIGRVHLREGRYDEAIDVFRQDLRLCVTLGDVRGQARMHEDIGRALLALERFGEARDSLDACHTLAEGSGFADLEFFALKDLALVSLGEGDLTKAEALLTHAAARIGSETEPYLHLLLEAARGEWRVAAGKNDAAEPLLRAATAAREGNLPDLELPLLLTLTESLLAGGDRATAQMHVRRALTLARSDGYARYLPRIRERMTQLALGPGIAEERGRLGDEGGHAPAADGYVILSHLGDGAFGSVYRAFDPVSAREVALKRLRLRDLYDGRHRERVERTARVELEAAAESKHPGIARVHAIGTDSADGLYVVQEFVPGPPLSLYMLTEQLPSAEEVLPKVRQMALALDELHARGVVHRDLKPANVIIRSADESPVLIDFGIAHVPRLERAASEDGVIGTPAYMAPEQASEQRVTGKTDVYALGVLTYEWLTGGRPIPFEDASIAEVLRRIQEDAPRSLAAARHDVPLPVCDLVARMLAKKPRHRPTAREVADACAEWCAR